MYQLIKLFVLVSFFAGCQSIQFKDEGVYNSFDLTEVSTIEVKPSTEIEKSPWGIQFNPLPPHHSISVSDVTDRTSDSIINILLERVNSIGVKWARFSINWSTVEDSTGAFHWNYVDQTIHGLKSLGIEPYVCLHGGHPVHTKLNPPVTDQQIQHWSRFVDSFCTRFRQKIKYYEIWNEPNYPSFWKPAPDATAYVNLVKTSAEIIRKHRSDAIILGGSTARLDFPYARQLFKEGIANYIDVFTIHPYNAIPEGMLKKIPYPVKTPAYYLPSSNQIQELKKLIQSYSTKINIWQAECGYPSGANSHGWQGTGPWGDTIQSKWILRRALTDLAGECHISAYFALSEFKLHPSDKKTNRKGLVKLHSMENKHAYFTYQKLNSVFNGKVVIKESKKYAFEITKQGSFPGFSGDDIIVMDISCENGNFLAYWLPVRMQENTIPATVKISKEKLTRDPVLLDLTTGKIYQCNSKNDDLLLPINDYPVFIGENRILR